MNYVNLNVESKSAVSIVSGYEIECALHLNRGCEVECACHSTQAASKTLRPLMYSGGLAHTLSAVKADSVAPFSEYVDVESALSRWE